MQTTEQAYKEIIERAQTLFLQKTKDYGTAWRVLRDISIVDQIYIKVKRICTLQEIQHAKVDESIADEWIGVINYAIIGMIQREIKHDAIEELSMEQVKPLFEKQADMAFSLMQNKNHDYGEAWRDMHDKSIADICMMKVFRMRQILENKEKLEVSEGIEGSYLDLINYAVFYLIKN